MGKGSNQRPRFVSVDEWARNFDRIFNPEVIADTPEPEDVGQEPVVEGDEGAAWTWDTIRHMKTARNGRQE